MSSKEELYKVLIESAPYGTLFFVYGVCIDANVRAFESLACDKRQLIGTSLDEITGEESTELVDLKLQLKRALKDKQTSFEWSRIGGSGATRVKVLFVNDSEKEIIVTLEDQVSAAPITSEPITSEPQVSEQQVSEPETSEQLEDAISTRDAEELIHDAATIPPEAYMPAAEQNLSPEPSPGKPSGSQSLQDGLFDRMTGLPNRQMLVKSLESFLSRNAGQAICSVLLMMDLDYFKDINSSLGHAAGDKLLKKIGRSIAGLVRGENLLARTSGDEYVLFIPKIAENASEAAWEAQALAEKVRELVSAPQFIQGKEVYLTTSIGIALLNDSGISAEQALQYVDAATHEAKRKGRNGISFYDPSVAEKTSRHLDLSNRLRKGLDNQEFVLFVQPQLSVQTGEVVGGEVLLRWINSDKVTSMPSEFIPSLEKSGLIVDVGRWVIRTSCEYLRNLIDEGLWKPHMRLSVNVSPRQFHDPQLLDVIEHSVESYNVDPRYLNFEITENLVIEDVDDAIAKMQQIKSLGSMFSIDDFGIGYSSMIYLKRLPLDHLKIDREFIRNLNVDQQSRSVVEAILTVSRQHNLSVTAEGVEDSETLDIVRDMGCSQYQGAHFSMPVPYARFKRMLAA
ncbi:MAG: putative bifunctional diguanylate cyclase/phosphodiesterase [bacterium]